MCGIAGVMMRGGAEPSPEVIGRLTRAMHHRGPDADGLYTHGSTALIDTRLAIVDVAGGNQPLYGPRGEAALVANGEIYNAPELRAALIADGDDGFRTLSDCEPPVHLFEREGAAFAQRLRGMYAIAIYEPGPRRLTLSRDLYGIKPLYYVQSQAGFAFASEPQALLAAGLVAPQVRPAAERELLQLKHVTGAATILKGIHRVEPGETLAVEDGQIVSRRRIDPLTPAQPSGAGATRAQSPRRPRPTLDAALDTFERVMTDSVRVHLRTDVPYGLFFSGGVDSSILLTLMQRLSGTDIQALTLGYGAAEPGAHVPGDESWTALEIAAATGAACRRVEMTAQDFWTLAPRIAAALDDPTTDAAILPTYMLGRAARAEGLKVVLCGEGADELFGGYSRYRRARATVFGASVLRLGRGDERRGVFDETPALRARLAGWSVGVDAVAQAERARWPSALRRLQAVDVVERLPNSLLVKLDRCLMANGVEGRTPFLDREVVDFSLSLPDALLTGLKHGKVLLREWLHRANPKARPFARKQGFNPPVGAWMAARADELSTLVAAQPAVAELAGRDVVEALFRSAERQAQPAWSLLFYALWHSRHVLGVADEGDIGEVLRAAAR